MTGPDPFELISVEAGMANTIAANTADAAKASTTYRKLSGSAKTQVDAMATRLGVRDRKVVNKALKLIDTPERLTEPGHAGRANAMLELEPKLKARHQASQRSKQNYQEREERNAGVALACATHLRALTPNDTYSTVYDAGGGRNPSIKLQSALDADDIVPASHPLYSGPTDPAKLREYRARRLQTQLSELFLARHPAGVEVQISFARDRRTLLVSSNVDSCNRDLIRLYGNRNFNDVLRSLLQPLRTVAGPNTPRAEG